MNDPLIIEVGRTIKTASGPVSEWLARLNAERNFERDFKQVFDDVLHQLSLFQRKLVTFSFETGNAEHFDINDNNITVHHGNIVPPPPPFIPPDWSSGHSIVAALGEGGRILQVPGVLQQDVEGILSVAMTAWQQLPDVALAVRVTLTYNADNREIMMTGERREFRIPTDHQAN